MPSNNLIYSTVRQLRNQLHKVLANEFGSRAKQFRIKDIVIPPTPVSRYGTPSPYISHKYFYYGSKAFRRATSVRRFSSARSMMQRLHKRRLEQAKKRLA